ncbi:cobalamin biosynthesis protein CobW [Enterovirga rhinocerotis]|uniref:Cobalamin biosynthesis protein CobW n=1 Tax=Enterovirga rhinocerotis TaxID=1339210 RepID=A0A4R7C8M0_9HYPH|nr:cobalamin biosynthesis protein CobW [Enterovirga rhinocerotis]TDR94603.1 cobalamin biosynthesis protein CobW [Enterovirga rhinocerotis]
MTSTSRIPVTVLTGFLGAGKTTLIRSLLQRADGRRIAVIVNEFGDLGFDASLIEDCADEACKPGDIVELTNGCICCTVADDFIPTMDKLLGRKLDAIVIETSGLALPQPLLKAFSWPGIKTRATVDGVVTVVDASALAEGRLSLHDHEEEEDPAREHDDPVEEVFEDQLACADLVVLSKADLVAPDALAAIEEKLREELRAGVKIVRSNAADLSPAVLVGLAAAAEDDVSARLGHHGEEEEHDHDDFDSIVVVPPAALDLPSVETAVRAALARPGVLRVKGYAAVDGKAAPLVVQAVGSRVELAFARPGTEAPLGLVVIGLKDMDAEGARAALGG